MKPRVHTCLWFDKDAEAAATLYTSLFPNSRITDVLRYGSVGRQQAGTVMLVTFELDGQTYTALNGGPQYPHTPAASLAVTCADQAEVDRCWKALSVVPEAERCGWLVDRYGVSWQIIPSQVMARMKEPDSPAKSRFVAAMMQMGKLDIAALEAAYAGN